ncbi:vWA domain-containing protein [Amycolatopsis rifamycinica]|uniref:VWFA domain-containing protein n=1 Tax=Amycolatopsis rifamycinica TaxID=287986 RepID=A0A066U7L9_9PSEU|nr:vWA domain-containing protein [Amycolatopsis rifamycinica]KDN21862.1 hypothetical protein DV20_13105 [Amycolatopsis rifamycinica]
MTRSVVADSGSHRLAVVPGSGPLSGDRIALPPGMGEGPCLMSIQHGRRVIRAAVHAVELTEVPAGHIAVDEGLAEAWDIGPADQPGWRLDRVAPVPVRSVVLDLPTEREPAGVARDIAHAGLAGMPLWVPGGDEEVSLVIAGVPYRVRELDVGKKRQVVARLTKDTEVELYASAVRAGVDVVVLADTSGSMGFVDLPISTETALLSKTTRRRMSRMEALKQSLRELLEIRLQVSGRISRFALLEFDHRVRHRFPRDGGMEQLDATSPDQLITEYRQAVALLAPDGRTDIGNALHEAANLLHRHGRPGNDKLVVLVSDGAEWTPAGDGGTGEVVQTVREPVSLMAHLNRELGIRLHAIGISTPEWYRQAGGDMSKRPLVPDHGLLEELVKVGGGDPTTVGGLDVLADYFAGLGGGIVHRVQGRLTEPARPGPLLDHTRAALDLLRPAGAADFNQRREDLKGRIAELAGQCNTEAQRTGGQVVWDDGRISMLSDRELGLLVTDDRRVPAFLIGLSEGFRPPSADPRFTAFVALLEEFRMLGRGRAVDYGRVAALCGTPVDSAGGCQVAVLQRVHDCLGDLRTVLAAGRAEPPPEPPAATGDFTYRD